MNNENKKFVPVGTKVTVEALAQLKELAKVTGVSIYVFLQVIVDAILKTLFTDDVQNDYVNEIVRLFFDYKKAKDGFSLISPTVKNLSVSQILAIIQQKNKSVPEIVTVRKNNAGEMMINRNNDEILKVFLQAFSPALLVKLEQIKNEYNKGTLTAALACAIYEALPEQTTISDEIAQLFEDAETFVLSSDFSVTEEKTNATLENMKRSDFEDKQKCKQTRGRNLECFEIRENRKEVSMTVEM